MIQYITIAGTHGIRRVLDWDSPESNLSHFLLQHDCKQLVTSPLKRYMWSTSADGIDDHNDVWDASGRALAHYIAPPLADNPLVAPKDTFLIAHSHGGNVVAYACGKYGLKINGLITVGMPIRGDLDDVYKAAAGNIERHLHLYAGWRDYWQNLGAMFDGRFGIHRKHPYAGKNGKVSGGDHGSILRDVKFFHMWLDNGWLDYWTGKKPC